MAVLVGVLAAATVVGWVLLRQDEAPAAESIMATASTGEVTRTVSASGTIEPAESESLSFAVSGTVSGVLVELGDIVAEGQALARVDKELLEAELDAAKSTVAAAEEDVEDAEGGSSVQLAAAQAQLTTARDDLRAAREAVAYAVLRAPFAGQVVSLDLAVGDVVGGSGSGASSSGASSGGALPGAQSSSGSTDSAAAIEIASVDRFVVETAVSSTDLESVKKGLQVEVTATGVEETLYGTVSEVGRVATTSSAGGAAFPVTVELTGEVSGVYGGTSANAEIIVQKRSDVLTVPTRAVRSEDGATYVLLVGEDGKTSRRFVEIGETDGASTEILEGLVDGDQVEVISLPAGGGRPGGGEGGGFPGGRVPGGGIPGGGFPSGGFPGGGFPGGGATGGGQ